MNRGQRTALAVAEEVAGELVRAGARAVLLTGSHARGDGGPESDIDLYAIGTGPEYWLERRDSFLISISWRTPEQLDAAFTSPSDASGFVPGWRQAVLLADPHGIGAQSVARAKRWTWDVVGDERLDEWVAEQLTGYAEEIHKLVSHLERGKLHFAAVQRSLLALRLPMIVAVHKRILYDSENYVWDLVVGRMGVEWAKNQSAALGLTGRPFHESYDGALALYVLACESASGLFNARQKAVVDHACNLARDSSDGVNVNSVILILIEQDGLFLMIEEDRGSVGANWYFPSGAVEAGESLVDAAVREALEKTGYAVELTHILRIDHGYFPASRQIPWWRHIVVATPLRDVLLVEPEERICAVDWLSPDDLEGLNLRSNDVLNIMTAYLETGPGLPIDSYAFNPTGTLRGFYS